MRRWSSRLRCASSKFSRRFAVFRPKSRQQSLNPQRPRGSLAAQSRRTRAAEAKPLGCNFCFPLLPSSPTSQTPLSDCFNKPFLEASLRLARRRRFGTTEEKALALLQKQRESYAGCQGEKRRLRCPDSPRRSRRTRLELAGSQPFAKQNGI